MRSLARTIGILALLVLVSPPQASAQATGACDVEGDWSTDFNRMHLNASGASGSYEYDQGRITGSLAGRNLTGTWSEAPTYAGPQDAGTFEWTFNDACTGFSGKWKHDADADWAGTWSGARITSATPTHATTPPTSTPTPTSTSPSGPSVGEIGDLFGNGSQTSTPATIAAPACDPTGIWNTTFGEMDLVLGDRNLSSTGPKVAMTGQMRGRDAIGDMGQVGYGQVAFRITFFGNECGTFHGTYDGYGGPFNWSGNRIVASPEQEARGAPAPSVGLALAVVAGAAWAARRRQRASK